MTKISRLVLRIPVFCLLLTFFCLVSCEAGTKEVGSKNIESSSKSSSSNVDGRGDRTVSVALNEVPNVDFGGAVTMCKEVGNQVNSLPVPWDEVEKQPGQFSHKFVSIAALYYPKSGIKLALELNPIDTNNLRVPKDLKGRAFDDPVVIARYKNAMKWVFETLKDVDLYSFTVGNEIDGILGQDDKKWQQYTKFFQEVTAYAHQLRPELVVGSKIMADGMLKTSVKRAKRLNQYSDAVMITHYPLTSLFTVMPPATVGKTMDKVVSIYPGSKPIYFMELGYPSSKKIGSSEEKQAQFVTETFKNWDRHKKRIKFINFVWLFDRADGEIATFEKYYRLSNPNFLQYLASLGLCNYDGSEKPAFKALRTETKKRSW